LNVRVSTVLISRCRIFIVCVVLLTGTVSCSTEKDNTIRFGLSAGAVTLDPRHATDAISHRLNRLVYQSLVDFDDNHRVIPSLADWREITPRQYRFTLRPERQRFHNGTQLTTADVKATYESLLDPSTVSPHRSTLTGIERIEVVNTETIDFYLREADPLFPARLVIGIMPRNLIASGHSFNREPVGNGPMQFASWSGEDRIRLVRRRDQRPFEFLTVKDSTVRVLKLVRGEIDLIQGDVPFELLDWLSEQDSVTVETLPGNIFTYIGFNLQDPALKKQAVRRAIASAIDRDAIITHVLGNAARKAGAMLPPDHWAGHPDLSGHAFDPDLARRLLAGAGYDNDNPLHLTYKTSSNPLRVRLATIIQYQLGEVGIDIDVQSYDWGTFYGDIKSGRFQLYSLSWVGLNLPDIFRYVFHSESVPPSGANRGRYDDPVTDKLIEQAAEYNNPERQAVIYRRLQVRLHQQLPYVPLWYEDNILARRKSIRGYTLQTDGNFDGLVETHRQTEIMQ